MEKHIKKIDQFIGVYDNFILPGSCERIINWFENQKQFQDTVKRIDQNLADYDANDEALSINQYNYDVHIDIIKDVIANFKLTLFDYLKETQALKYMGVSQVYYESFKIQKTVPGGGYHIWHVEKNFNYEMLRRALAFIIYLNDVEDGGETEFLKQSVRIKPKTGRVVIWPAAFPFIHRGNPPLKQTKYILTSWISGEIRENIQL